MSRLSLVWCYLFGIFLVQGSIIWSVPLKGLKNHDCPSERSRNYHVCTCFAMKCTRMCTSFCDDARVLSAVCPCCNLCVCVCGGGGGGGHNSESQDSPVVPRSLNLVCIRTAFYRTQSFSLLLILLLLLSLL